MMAEALGGWSYYMHIQEAESRQEVRPGYETLRLSSSDLLVLLPFKDSTSSKTAPVAGDQV